MNTSIHKQSADVLFGSGTLSRAGQVAMSLDLQRVLIITDGGIASLGYPQRVAKALEEAGVESLLWDQAVADVPVNTLRRVTSLVQANDVDGIIGIGGGSCLDTAKMVAVLAPNDEEEILSDIPAYLSGEKVYENPVLACILIPTTAGTGSEVTCIGVVSDPVTDRKIGLPMTPAYAIVDPELTLGSPAHLTAWCGLDAFAHALESLTSVEAGPHSQMCALEAIRLLSHWLPVACQLPMDLEAREQLAFASNLAGIAFSEANVHLGHSVAHALGHAFHIPHGLCCALVTPGVIEYTARDFPGLIRKTGLAMGLSCADTSDAAIGGVVAQAHTRLMQQLGLPTLKEFTAGQGREIRLEDALSLTGQALADPIVTFYGAPFEREAITELIEHTFYWPNSPSNHQ